MRRRRRDCNAEVQDFAGTGPGDRFPEEHHGKDGDDDAAQEDVDGFDLAR